MARRPVNLGSVPNAESPLEGGCGCGAVRFRLGAPFLGAGYCHCRRCQRRSGTPSSLNAQLESSGFELLAGALVIRTWRPEGGRSKSFCGECGGHLFSGDPDRETTISIRFGALDGDPEVRPAWRQWISSAPAWFEIPADGLPRYPEGRPVT